MGSLRLSPEEREDLVAYLDGELDEAASRAIATKLTSSAAARRDVDTLMATWDMLDHLERPFAPEDFASRTLTNLEGEGKAFDRGLVAATSWGRIAARYTGAVTLVAGAVVTGWVVAKHVVPDPTARLARKLSLAEHLDEYRAVGGDFEFLRQLDELPEFNAARE